MTLVTKKIAKKTVTFLIGRGDHCTCGDCPVLYGGTCPTTEEYYRKRKAKKQTQ